jgi:hypothetical protein
MADHGRLLLVINHDRHSCDAAKRVEREVMLPLPHQP